MGKGHKHSSNAFYNRKDHNSKRKDRNKERNKQGLATAEALRLKAIERRKVNETTVVSTDNTLQEKVQHSDA
jgi:hypothetical protein